MDRKEFGNAYRQSGFCQVGKLDRSLIDAIGQQIDEFALGLGSQDDPAIEVRGSRVFQIYDVPLRPPPLGALPSHPLITGVVSELLDEDAVVAWSLLLNKASDEGSNWEIPWHQDTSIYCEIKPPNTKSEMRGGFLTFRPRDDSIGRLVVARVAIDEDTTESGGIFVLPGTHLLGNRWPDGGRAFEDDVGIPVELKRGELFFFNPLLMHRAQRNLTTSQRRIVHIYYRPVSMKLPNGAQWINWSALNNRSRELE